MQRRESDTGEMLKALRWCVPCASGARPAPSPVACEGMAHVSPSDGPPPSVEPWPVTAQIGALTIGGVSYGRHVLAHPKGSQDVHMVFMLRGRAELSTGTDKATSIAVGSAAVFANGRAAQLITADDSAVLTVAVSRTMVEAELEHLLGQALGAPLELGAVLDLTSPLGRSWGPVLMLMIEELRQPTPLTQHPVAAKRLDRLVLDALLLGHEHNYRAVLDTNAVGGPVTAIGRAIRLIEADPTQTWSTDRLAGEVHLSARALQAGFQRDVGMSPMDYVRKARLRLVRQRLMEGGPHTTTVRAIAQRHGFGHVGRFAATYRERYGESPVETLRRPPD